MENVTQNERNQNLVKFQVDDQKTKHNFGDHKNSQVIEQLQKNIQNIKISHLIQPPQLAKFEKPDSEDQETSCTLQTIYQQAQKISSSKYFKYCLLTVLSLFLVSCLLQNPRKSQQKNKIAEILQLVCHVLFIFFFLCRVLKIKRQNKFWLILDFVTILTGIIGFIIQDQVARYFKAVRTVKLLFFIKEIQIFNKPSTMLVKSLAKFGNILVPALIIIYVYAVVGLYTFADFQYNKCRSASNLGLSQNWTVYDHEVYLCGQKKCPVYNGEQLQCLNPIDYQVQPNENELVNIIQGNSLLKYSNIFFAVLSTFKQTFVTGSSRLIILYKQVLNPVFVEIYFYSYIYLISYIYLNIFYALIITSEWDGDQQEPQTPSQAPLPIKNQQNKNLIEQDEKLQTSEQKFLVEDFKIENSGQRQNSQPCFNFNKSEPQTKTGNKIQNSPQDAVQESCMVNGSLVLKKARIFNVFENCQQNPQLISKNQSLMEKDNLVDDDITIATQFPSAYRKYQIINNIIILLCCVNLSLDFHEQDPKFKFIVDCFDFVFYCLLVVELVVRVLIQRYSLRKIQLYTKFEILIAIVCTGGVIYQAATAQNFYDFFSVTVEATGVIRSFKYLRIMILIFRSTIFKQARLILESTFRSLYVIRHMVVVWFLIVIIFGIIGFHLHSHKTLVNPYTHLLDLEHGQEFQVSFDSIYNSIIYTMLTFYNQQWDYIMFEQYLGGGALLVIWQLLSICVGLLLFSKYFMALLMKQLDSLIDKSIKDVKQQNVNIQNGSDFNLQAKQEFGQGENKVVPIDVIKIKQNKKSVIFDEQIRNIQECRMMISRMKSRKIVLADKCNTQSNSNKNTQYFVNRALFLLRKAIEHKIYKIVFGAFIILECIVLVNTHPHVDRASEQILPYLMLEKINKVYFIIDLFMNLLVFGLFQQESSYLRKSWLNWLNIFLIIISVVSFTSINNNVAFNKIQKIKVLRLLFFLQFRYKHDWNMRITYHSFVQLLPKVITLFIITLLMYSFFALILVKVYKDDHYNCYNYYQGAQIVTKNDCLIWGGDWVQQSVNVSNLLNSTFYLFAVATMEGWISLLYPAMDLAGQDYNPVKNANKYISTFFVLFFFFGNLIMLNVFIGLSVSNFKRLKDKNTGQQKLNKKQKQWLSVKSQIYRLNPSLYQYRPNNIIRGKAYDIANHFLYKIIQGIFFCGYLIAMSLFKTNMTEKEKKILLYCEYFFVLVLVCEYLIQLLAFGVRFQYKRSFIYKNIVVIYAIIYIIITQSLEIDKYNSRILGGIFIALQFIRYLSLLDQIPFAKKLLNTIVSILPQTSNILLMICITLFIYAIIGMELFAFLRPNIELDNFNQNYTNFLTALFALIKFSTLQSPMQQISDAAQRSSPNFLCNQVYSYQDYLIHGQKGCGNMAMSYIFFLSFHVFYSMLLMSTVMAVIVDSYIEVKRQQEAPITKLVLQKVKAAWCQIDPQATGYIPYRQFWMFTAKLLEIYMGKKKAHSNISSLFASKQQFLKQMEIPIYENQNRVLCFQFHEVIEALTRIYMQNNFGTTVTKKTQKMFHQRHSVMTNNEFKKSFYTSSHVSTLIILKSGLRWWKKLATGDNGRIQYKNVIEKFNRGKVVTGKKDPVQQVQ